MKHRVQAIGATLSMYRERDLQGTKATECC